MLNQTCWKSEIRSAYRSNKELETVLNTNFDTKYPVFIPKRLAQKIQQLGPSSALWKQFVPNNIESLSLAQTDGLLDPIGDHKHAKGGGIIHRYQNRVLFAPTTVCPVQCRYCFRKNELHNNDEIFRHDFKKAISYLESHCEIEEVIFTGGDPLMLSDDKIHFYLDAFATIDHIKFIRFHTRMPVITPQRLTKEFNKLIEGFNKRFTTNLVIHTNHLEEFDEIVDYYLQSITISKLSQSVLLKGVNDNEYDLSKLFRHLSSINIRPYYLHHPDKVYGGMHFYLSQERGTEIYQKLAKIVPGWMLPRYVVDPSSGSGKISAFFKN